jgi:hypothetical protein
MDIDASSMSFRGEYEDCSCRLSGISREIDAGERLLLPLGLEIAAPG